LENKGDKPIPLIYEKSCSPFHLFSTAASADWLKENLAAGFSLVWLLVGYGVKTTGYKEPEYMGKSSVGSTGT
jgi:hypothetical protein